MVNQNLLKFTKNFDENQVQYTLKFTVLKDQYPNAVR